MDSTSFFSFAIMVPPLFFENLVDDWIPGEMVYLQKKNLRPIQRDQGIIGGATLLDSRNTRCPLEIR